MTGDYSNRGLRSSLHGVTKPVSPLRDYRTTVSVGSTRPVSPPRTYSPHRSISPTRGLEKAHYHPSDPNSVVRQRALAADAGSAYHYKGDSIIRDELDKEDEVLDP